MYACGELEFGLEAKTTIGKEGDESGLAKEGARGDIVVCKGTIVSGLVLLPEARAEINAPR